MLPFKTTSLPASVPPEVMEQTYNAINGNYQKIIKQLDAMLPREDSKPKEENDGFDAFVSGRDEV